VAGKRYQPTMIGYGIGYVGNAKASQGKVSNSKRAAITAEGPARY